MKFRVGIAALVASLAAGAFAQTTPSPVSPAPPGANAGSTPAPAAAGQGVTINAATGEQVITQGTTPTGAVIVTPTNARPALLRTGTNTALAGRSNITPAQMQNINRLVVDLNALGLPAREPAEQQRGLNETLQAAPVGNVRPAPALITRLGSDLATLLPSLNLTAQQRRQLAIDLNLALNSANLTAPEAQRVLADARSLLQGSALKNPQGVEQLLAGLGTIVNQVQGTVDPPRAQSASPSTQTGQSGAGQTGQGSGSSRPAPNTTER